MRGALLVFVLALVASPAMAQDDGATWIAHARQAIADHRYDTAQIDLDRAEAESPGLEPEITAARDALSRARFRSDQESAVHVGWTHSLSVGLFGGAAFAFGSGASFAAAAAYAGFGTPRCSGCDYQRGFYDDAFFGLAVASGISVLALVITAAWLITEGPAIEGQPTLVPLVSATNEGFTFGVSGLL